MDHGRSLEKVLAKRAAEATNTEQECRITCSSCIVDEYYKYIRKERAGLQDMPRGAKGWWRKSRRLMQTKGNMSSIPALKNAENQWVLVEPYFLHNEYDHALLMVKYFQ